MSKRVVTSKIIDENDVDKENEIVEGEVVVVTPTVRRPFKIVILGLASVLCIFMVLSFISFCVQLLQNGVCKLGGKGSVEEEFFGEELLIRPLPDGNVLAHLQFTNSYYLNKSEPNLHFSLFPKPLAQIIDKFDVENLQLTFTQGRWNGEEWGAPILDAPHGVQLISSFYNETDLELNWKRLINSLSGLFCSSLNALDETTTAVPTLSYQYFKYKNEKKDKEEKELHKEFQESWKLEFQKEAEKDGKSLEEYFAGKGIVERSNQEKNFLNNVRRNKNKKPNIKFAAMPSESVCTENLTPWMKLLPCRDQSGLGTLLNPLYLYDTLFHSMTIYVRSFPSEDGNTKIELSQTLSIVFPAAQKQHFSIASLYGANDLTSCQLANISNVYVQLDENNPQYSLSPPPHQMIGSLSSYSLSSDNLKLKITKNIQSNNNIVSQPSDNDIIAHRYLLGYGDERGGVVTQITNTNPNDTLHIYYFDYLPWFLPVYYHKLKIIIDGRVVEILDIDEWKLEPGRDHGRPSIIELGMFIPPSTTTTIMYYFEKSFLIWTEHPPDAHRGFDVVSACITTQYDGKPEKLKYTGLEWSPVLYQEDKGEDLYHHHTYTEGLLVLAPTPDFSMPYNVITLTCTMFTLVFSSTINVITRRFDYLMKGGEYSTGRLSLVLYRKLRNYFLK